MSLNVVPVHTLASRICHLAGGALLFAAAMAPDMYKGELELKWSGKAFAGISVLVLLTGLFNAVMLKPKNMGTAAGKWRMMVYGGKFALFAAATPLSNLVFGEHARCVKIASLAGSLIIGSYARFYREFHSKTAE